MFFSSSFSSFLVYESDGSSITISKAFRFSGLLLLLLVLLLLMMLLGEGVSGEQA